MKPVLHWTITWMCLVGLRCGGGEADCHLDASLKLVLEQYTAVQKARGLEVVAASNLRLMPELRIATDYTGDQAGLARHLEKLLFETAAIIATPVGSNVVSVVWNDLLFLKLENRTAMAADDVTSPTRYSGSLKRSLSAEESSGTRTTGQDAGAYYLETNEQKTGEGIKPERRWLTLTLVFPTAPTIPEAYEAAIAEAERAALKGLDVSVRVCVGDKAVRKGWRQLPDPGGAHVFVEYQADTRTLRRLTKVLKQLPP
jgi:hypothetical protein